MKKSHTLAALVLGFMGSFFTASTFAQDKSDCTVNYTRSACPGKEAESFAKCDGKASCSKSVAAASSAACQDLALKACANDRLDVTKSKIISATYKGQPLTSASGKADFCVDYANRSTEFDKCAK